MDRVNGQVATGGLIRPFLDAVVKEEAPDGGTPSAPPTPPSPGASDAGTTDAGAGGGPDAGSGPTSYWQIIYDGPSFSWTHDEDGTWHVTFGSGHLGGKAGGKPAKKP